ncbi:MAG TPA: PDR/VanB family oxidoreductase [Mycobacterium sp.]|nr:PDR/VanB family oxidoreductase [Mycobacterium sp.]
MSTRARSARSGLTGLAEAAVSGLWALSASLRGTPEPAVRDRTRLLRVVGRQVVAHDQDVVALTLAAADGGPLPRWFPGAHIDVRLPSGRVRQYSLCGDPGRTDSVRIAVRRIPHGGGGSVEVHEALHVGATVSSGGPRNAFPVALPGYGSPARRLRFIAGGIGITPILPMLSLARRAGVDWSMVYTGRSRDSLPFVEEVAGLAASVEIRTDDVRGVPGAGDLLGDCADGTAVYACGPAALLTSIRARLAGRDNVELHFERFAAAPVLDGRPFSVAVASTGQIVQVGAQETLLAALQRAGVSAPYSCQQGFCGTCRTRVLGGGVDHHDNLLTEPERDAGTMLTCVSRAPRGQRLTLDL